MYVKSLAPQFANRGIFVYLLHFNLIGVLILLFMDRIVCGNQLHTVYCVECNYSLGACIVQSVSLYMIFPFPTTEITVLQCI